MILTISKILFALLFLVIVSQGIFYLLAFGKALSEISIEAFAEQRKAVDLAISLPLKIIYITGLLTGLFVFALTLKNHGTLLFITVTIALVCLAADLFLAVRYNLPINACFHNYSSENTYMNWQSLRQQWLQTINLRALIQVVGFLSLMTGMLYK